MPSLTLCSPAPGPVTWHANGPGVWAFQPGTWGNAHQAVEELEKETAIHPVYV